MTTKELSSRALAPSARRWRALAVVVLLPVLPALQFVDPAGGAPGEIWRILAGAAVGALATAFVAGRNAVTRPDLDRLKAELLDAIRMQSPWTAAERDVMNRLGELKERDAFLEGRVNDAITAAQTAVGVRDLVATMFKERLMGGEG